MFNLIIKKLIIIIAMCKTTYPKLINLKKWVLLLTGIKNTRGHYARKKILRNTNDHPCRFGPFILRHDWVTGGTEMHATHRSKWRNRGRTMDTAPSQRISSGRLTSGRNRWTVQWWKWRLRKICYRTEHDEWSFKKLEIIKNGNWLNLYL